jgi:hypothetical protein
MERSRKNWLLRIVWTSLFAALGGLLIVLWVRDRVTYIQGHLPGVSRFVITSYCFSDMGWHTVTAYVVFGLRAERDSQWEIGQIPGGSGGMWEGFAIIVEARARAITVAAPHWFLILLCAIVAVTPWTPIVFWSRRFSLRTLLIVTTLVAVVLGLIAISL